MTVEISLRPALPDDEPWLLDLRRRVIAPYRAPLGLPNDDAALLVSVREHYADGRIICHAGKPIGLFKACRDADALLLSQVQLEPAFQRRGIGEGLIRECLAQAERENLPVRLLVLHGNPARRLYERLGFREISADEVVATMIWQPTDPSLNP